MMLDSAFISASRQAGFGLHLDVARARARCRRPTTPPPRESTAAATATTAAATATTAAAVAGSAVAAPSRRRRPPDVIRRPTWRRRTGVDAAWRRWSTPPPPEPDAEIVLRHSRSPTVRSAIRLRFAISRASARLPYSQRRHRRGPCR